MGHEHFLCSASAIKDGEKRTFKIYKLRGQTFKIYNDRGHSHISHGSLRMTEHDIKSEINTVYDVQGLEPEGSVREGLRSSTWPATCQACSNCGCAPTRRVYGGKGYCHRCHYLACRLEAATRCRFGEPNSLGRSLRGSFADNVSRLLPEEFVEFKNGYISWVRQQIKSLRMANDHRRGNLETADLTRKFDEVITILNIKAKWSADKNLLACSFDGNQMAVIFSLLDDMVDAWKRNSDRGGVTAAFEAVHQLHLAQPIADLP